jgi:hypothetical protein
MIVSFFSMYAQVPDKPVVSQLMEQQLEANAEANEDIETEDDGFLQSMVQLAKHPINLNSAGADDLKELQVLTAIQIQQIISYRNLLGNFINLYELQAVPGLTIGIIERILPYVTVAVPENLFQSIGERLRGGNRSLLLRTSQVLERQEGFKRGAGNGGSSYAGSRQRILARYKYQFKNLLQYGILGEKDAGEQFFKGAQRTGFDFYSAHLFARNIGIVKSLAVGDFTVNLGQGLVQWQSLAFRKGADIPNIKRQLSVLRPYHSAGESNFHRGFGVTVAKNHLEATLFASYKKVDGNFVGDSLQNEWFISSLPVSGLHRTKNEIADRGIQRQFSVGGNVSYNFRNLHVGVNGVQYQFKWPIQKNDDPYNLYALAGRSFGNYSFDYGYTFRNLHVFGEAAFTQNLDRAFVNGLVVSVDAKVDMSLLHRHISPRYQSLYTNAFTENSLPNNEQGIFAGLSVRPVNALRFDAYVDFYSFPWLKYLVDAPSSETDFMVQAGYKPNRKFETYIRYRNEIKGRNDNPGELVVTPVEATPKQNLRVHLSYKKTPALTIRSRLELVWFAHRTQRQEKGLHAFLEGHLKPQMKKYSGSIRFQYFKTGGYNSRLYAYENDVLYSYSIPVFYDAGYRYYLNLTYDLSKQISLWIRFAQTIYLDKQVIGTALDEISGNKRTEVKLQVISHF